MSSALDFAADLLSIPDNFQQKDRPSRPPPGTDG
jgi:hypothetical protein